jgi:2-hydroxychromene-2-carboxylate isomerase
MLRNFAHDQDIANEADLSEILNALALPAATILTAAQSDENKSRLREQTDRAKSLGIFGAPTFLVRGEMYWGNDRLDDAIACARGSASG